MADGLSLEDCVETIAATLPICSVRKVAYSTFTIIHLINNETAEIMQYDNPLVIMLRDGKNYDYPKTELNIGGKKIYKSVINLEEGDIFVAMSDGCPHAGIGTAYNFGWERDDIISFVETVSIAGYTAKTLSTIIADECDKLYGFEPGDRVRCAHTKARAYEYTFRSAVQPRRLRPYDVAFLLKRGKTHHLRRNNLVNRSEIPRQAA